MLIIKLNSKSMRYSEESSFCISAAIQKKVQENWILRVKLYVLALRLGSILWEFQRVGACQATTWLWMVLHIQYGWHRVYHPALVSTPFPRAQICSRMTQSFSTAHGPMIWVTQTNVPSFVKQNSPCNLRSVWGQKEKVSPTSAT